MALGRTVICTLTDSLYEGYELPIINSSPENLEVSIKEVYDNREILVEKGQLGSEFVNRNHNSEVIAERVLQKYKSILE
jgi:hypothetical protein